MNRHKLLLLLLTSMLTFSVRILYAQTAVTTDTITTYNLDDVTVHATRLLLVTKNDTTIYDLDALTVKEGALLRDAFERLPGMSFRDGTLYHNGREVKSILINGVDFSRKDPMLALQALPSYIMKDVKVYERQSDFSIMHGIDDGFRELVADVSVRRKYMGTWTGEIAAGGGTDERFLGRGYANTFTDQYRVSLFGNANNINEQLWYGGDGKQRAGQEKKGDNRYYTPGATFFWKTKHKQDEAGYFKIESNVDYNKELYDNATQTERELYLSDGSLYSASNALQNNNADRLAGLIKADWKITDATTVNYLGNFEVKQRTEEQSSLAANWNAEPQYGEHLADTLQHLSTASPHRPDVTDLQRKSVLSQGEAAWYSHNLRMYHSIADQKLYFALIHDMLIGYDSDTEHNHTYYKYFNDEHSNSTLVNRYKETAGNSLSQEVMARVMKYFNIEGFKRFCLSVAYTYGERYARRDDRGYLLNSLGSLYSDPATSYELFGTLPTDELWRSVAREDETTRYWETENREHSIAPWLNFQKGVFYMEFKPTIHFCNEQLIYAKGILPTLTPKQKNIYTSLLTQIRLRSDRIGTLRLRGGITPTLPDIQSLVTYPDMADRQYIRYGNDALKKSTEYALQGWYSKNFAKVRDDGNKIIRQLGTDFSFIYTENAFSNLLTYNLTTGAVTSKPINVSGNWNGRLGANFATPLDASQRFWVETSANVNMLHTNSYAVIESEEETPLLNSNTLCAYSAMVKPRVKFDNMDASVAYELTLEDNRGTYLSVNNKEQWQHHIQGRLTWRLPWSLSLDAAVNYHNYTTYLSADSRMDWLMTDFSIERPFLKGKNLFVELSAHDLLNENNGFSRVYDATSLTHTYNKVLGRYAMLSVRYRFATKKK